MAFGHLKLPVYSDNQKKGGVLLTHSPARVVEGSVKVEEDRMTNDLRSQKNWKHGTKRIRENPSG